MTKDVVQKKKKNTRKHLIGKKEFIFNFLSLIVVLAVGLYFGGRSLYYYSKQNMPTKDGSLSLVDAVINGNKLISDGDGFYMNKKGYYFKGSISNNYVLYSNQLFRIISINNDNQVKLVSDSNVSTFMWGEESKYSDSNLNNWLTKTDKEHSGVYYNTLVNVDNYLVKTSYSEDILEKNKIKNSKKKYSDYVTTLSVQDYLLSGSKNSYLNNGRIFYLLGLDKDMENLYVEEDGSIQSCDSLDGYGVRAVITLKNGISITSGNGTKDDPYMINQGNDKTYVNSYISLGNDIWRVIEDRDGLLKLSLKDYIKNNKEEVVLSFGNDYNYNLEDNTNLAFYLNNTYLNSLNYVDKIVENEYYIGELNTDSGYLYQNIYNNTVKCRVGLLNIFDYRSSDYDNYYNMNTSSELRYSTYSKGLLEEVDVNDMKHIVPVISIKSEEIKSGKGSLDDPYTIG